MGGQVILLLAALAAYDPNVDTPVQPWTGMAGGALVQRHQDDFGLSLEVTSPRFLDDRLALRLAGGLGWFPDLRRLPATADDELGGAWSLYGQLRVGLDFAIPLAIPIGRLYVTAGPSLLFLSSRLSSVGVAPGGFGLVGVELFAGDGLQTHPIAFFVELGGVAHAASADIERRTGAPVSDERTVDRLIGTGFLVQGGLRVFLWR